MYIVTVDIDDSTRQTAAAGFALTQQRKEARVPHSRQSRQKKHEENAKTFCGDFPAKSVSLGELCDKSKSLPFLSTCAFACMETGEGC
jgi:hypothetical protein